MQCYFCKSELIELELYRFTVTPKDKSGNKIGEPITVDCCEQCILEEVLKMIGEKENAD